MSRELVSEDVLNKCLTRFGVSTRASTYRFSPVFNPSFLEDWNEFVVSDNATILNVSSRKQTLINYMIGFSQYITNMGENPFISSFSVSSLAKQIINSALAKQASEINQLIIRSKISRKTHLKFHKVASVDVGAVDNLMGIASYFRLHGYVLYTAEDRIVVQVIKTLKDGIYAPGTPAVLFRQPVHKSHDLMKDLSIHKDLWLPIKDEVGFAVDLVRCESGFLFRYFFTLEAVLPEKSPIDHKAALTIKRLWLNNFYPV